MVNHLLLERDLAVQTWTSNCKPESKTLVTWLLEVCGSREMPKNLDLKVSIASDLREFYSYRAGKKNTACFKKSTPVSSRDLKIYTTTSKWIFLQLTKTSSVSNDHGDVKENGKKAIGLDGKKQLCACVTLFCTFLSRHCTTSTWKWLTSRFVEDGNTRQQLSFSFPELWCRI